MHTRPFIASFTSTDPVRRALGRLHAAGVERDDIALLMTQEQHDPHFDLVAGRKLAEGVASGAALGALLGGLIGAVVALGGLSSIGIAIATLAGLGLGGIVGIIAGAIIGFDTPIYRARLGDADAAGDRILLAVWVADAMRAERVSQILAK